MFFSFRRVIYLGLSDYSIIPQCPLVLCADAQRRLSRFENVGNVGMLQPKYASNILFWQDPKCVSLILSVDMLCESDIIGDLARIAQENTWREVCVRETRWMPTPHVRRGAVDRALAD